MKFKIIGTFLLLVSSKLLAGNVSYTTKITAMYTYGEDTGASQNAIVIKVSNPIRGCTDGFWVSPQDNIANKNIPSFLLSAFHSGSNVYFAAYDHQLLFGNHCKAHSVGIVK